MASFVAGVIALLIGIFALGCGAATPRRRTRKRLSLLALGVFSTFAAVTLIYRAGGFPALAVVGIGLIVLPGIGVVAWYFVGMITSVDEALTKREPPPPTDFAFLHEPRLEPMPSKPKRASITERMGLTTARERIARMNWFFRKPPG